MPDIWTHILFGEEVFAELPESRVLSKEWESKVVKWGKEQPKLYRFAAQGPDFFFFYRFWPWMKTHGIDDIGRAIQNQLGGQFVHSAIQYLKSQQPQGYFSASQSYPHTVDNSGDKYVESKEYQALVVYLIGFICHYALDAATHPFIHYKSGVYRKGQPDSYQYYGNHKIFEELIDTILLQEKRGLKTALEPVHCQIDMGQRVPDAILKLYQYQVAQLLEWDLELETFNQAYLDMLKGWKLFHDPKKYKDRLTKLIQWISLGKLRYSQFFYPHEVDDSVDYLNREQREWCHPGDQDEKYTESFDQLWDQAKEWAKSWIGIMFTYLQGKIDDQELLEGIPNLSFSTGKEPGSRDEKQLRYFDPVVSLK